MKLGREIKVAFLVLITLGAFLWGFNYLKGRDILSKQRRYYAVYEQVGGLQVAAPVFINGLQIGQVSKIGFTDKSGHKVIIEFVVKSDVDIPNNSKAKIYSTSMIGAMALKILLGNSQTFAKSGDTLINEFETSLFDEVSQKLMPIKQKTEKLATSLDSLVSVFQNILTEDTQRDISSGFKNLNKTIRNLSNTTAKLDDIMEEESERISLIIQNIESISTNLETNNEEITHAIKNFSQISDDIVKANIASTLQNLNQLSEDLAQILSKTKNGQGSLGKLVNDEELYNNLNGAAEDLNKLIEDIKAHPKKYVGFSIFGGKNK